MKTKCFILNSLRLLLLSLFLYLLLSIYFEEFPRKQESFWCGKANTVPSFDWTIR